MFSQTLFCRLRGAALMMLLLFCCFTSTTRAQGVLQLLNCGQLTIEIVPRPYNGQNDQVSCTPCCAGNFSCERIEYEVFLQAKNVPGGIPLTTGNFTLSYEELFIVLHLNRVNALLSSINEAQTEVCLANYLQSAADDYQANTAEDEVALRLSSLTSGDGMDTPGIPFTNYRSAGHLFSVIVDAFPNENFGLDCTTFTYVCASNCPNEPILGIGTAPAVFPMPTTTNTGLSLSFGTINCNPESYIDLPIEVNSNLTGTINLFDFAIVVSSTAPDGFYAAPEVIGATIPVTVLPNDATGQYIVRFKYSSIPADQLFGNIQLGLLRIYRPSFLCQGYTLSASLVPGRIRMTSQSISGCRAIQLGATTTAQCVVPPMPICNEKIQFNVTRETSPTDCNTVLVYATLSWDPANFNGQNSLNFNQIREILDFTVDNGVSIVEMPVLEGMSCPSTTDPVTCPGNCLQFGPNSVSLCINTTNPITVQNGARIIIKFQTPSGCIQKAAVRKMSLLVPGGLVCQPDVNPPVGFPYCSAGQNIIRGDIATEQKCWIDEVKVNIVANNSTATSCNDQFLTGTTNLGACVPYSSVCLCPINIVESYIVTPTKNDNPLNGVSTFDLVLISKHILGLEPLGSPYKMIAADANKSGSITTFDIVELRKLILGTYPKLPLNTSWRFVDKSFNFPNANNPFQSVFPEFRKVELLPDELVDFIGIKIGDVNNSVLSGCPMEPVNLCQAFNRPAGTISMREPRRSALKTGDYYTLPVRSGGEVALIAWQSGFRFDPTVLELVGPSLGDVPGLSADNFNLVQAGEGIVRALWFAQPDAWEEEALQPGQTLFHLTFRVKQDIPEATPLLQVADDLMSNLGWTMEGATYSLQNAPVNQRDNQELPASPVWLRCYPNPVAGALTFDVLALPQPRHAQLLVFDAFGHRLWWRDLEKETGPVQINVPEAAGWSPGVYHWELRFDRQKLTGSFVRQ